MLYSDSHVSFVLLLSNAHEKVELAAIFEKVSLLEMDFWHMAYSEHTEIYLSNNEDSGVPNN